MKVLSSPLDILKSRLNTIMETLPFAWVHKHLCGVSLAEVRLSWIHGWDYTHAWLIYDAYHNSLIQFQGLKIVQSFPQHSLHKAKVGCKHTCNTEHEYNLFTPANHRCVYHPNALFSISYPSYPFPALQGPSHHCCLRSAASLGSDTCRSSDDSHVILSVLSSCHAWSIIPDHPPLLDPHHSHLSLSRSF